MDLAVDPGLLEAQLWARGVDAGLPFAVGLPAGVEVVLPVDRRRGMDIES